MKSSTIDIYTPAGDVPVVVRIDNTVFVPSLVRGRRVDLCAVRDAISRQSYSLYRVPRWILRVLRRGANVRHVWFSEK